MALTQVSTGGIKDGQVHTADLADSQITAAKLHADALDRTYTLGADGSNHYTFTGEGLTGAVNDPTLYLTRGKTYRFVNGNSAGAHPFRIQTTVNGSAGTEYNTGVTNNGGAGGSTIVFEVPHDAPDVLYYQCTSHNAMGGILYVTGALADGAVTTAKLAADAVTGAKIANDAIDSEHFADGSIDTAHIADQAVTLAKLPHGTSSNDGKFLRANNGADPTFESLPASGISNIVEDTSPQLGGDLQSNGAHIAFADNDKALFGSGNDLQIYHNGTHSYIDTNTGTLYIRDGGSEKLRVNGYGTAITGGLLFGTDTAAANALDDYEEGTWTPKIKTYSNNTWADASMDSNGTINSAKYTKIGNVVHFHLNWNNFDISSASYCVMGNLPFTSATSGGGFVGITYANVFGNSTSLNAGYIGGSSTLIEFYRDGNGWNSWDTSSSRYLNMAGTYLAA